jgi:glycosyltransferase involved in cell wall biosynthesis
MLDNPLITVLMSCYNSQSTIREAVDSILTQTVGNFEFIIIDDASTDDTLKILREYKDNRIILICNELNRGLGYNLNYGVNIAKGDYIARMDSDDISYPDRCERQLKIFETRDDVDLVSGTIEEFIDTKDVIESRRELPVEPEEVYEYCKTRCPFNHPCIMYKKTAIEESGGYIPFKLEDYYLWVRVLQHGFRGYNIKESLLWMRAGANMYKRRGGKAYAEAVKELFKYMRDTGFITKGQYFKCTTVRCAGALAPNWLRKFLYKTLLRKT